MNIVVLAGGNSTEREVSIVSGQGVCGALRERNHRAVLLDAYFGRDKLDEIYADIFGTEDALVRINFVNGTHAITCALFGCLRPGDVLLMCSDGLSNPVSDRTMARILAEVPFYQAADALVAKALERGGQDNITVLLIGVEPVAPAP